MTDIASLPYRPCAGVMLVNRAGQVFVGQRLDSVLEAWQMPQGGIDPGEDPLEAAWRELWEETGVARDHAELVATAPDELTYDLPEDLIGKVWKGKWRGQRQRWFLFRFLGEDSDVNIATAEPEFRAWRWAEPEELPDIIVPFKRVLYRQLLDIFTDALATVRRS
ncbi:putative (di)nucleoside polyphosphate hydrolase [Sphingomonas naasensis]|uniref:RNA pyrophosphohydrolase n=1 Tax=Sphingomonas naasensis TaxID=1344951 RepID=A0A4S1WVV0_9SPHN|nr:RNA pyrophosphohydrolase [Sphingomonas naasensis]NIJ18442.1 putative (di)nucleoside polyphosphate hydrolase [Sphingomonas naasensis]TGX45706.1 RNA pyrophosphohydrolase [Sphingomonas naasensis]